MALATGLAMAIYQIFSIIDEDMIPISMKKIFILDETEKWYKRMTKNVRNLSTISYVLRSVHFNHVFFMFYQP